MTIQSKALQVTFHEDKDFSVFQNFSLFSRGIIDMFLISEKKEEEKCDNT